MTNHLSNIAGSNRWWQSHNLYLIRGLPGSGKSTLAKLLMNGYDNCEGVAHHETDTYFTSKAGIYLFKPELISDAHVWNQQQVIKSMKDHVRTIFVSNTFSQQWEIVPYLEMADEHGYAVSIIECQNDFGSKHGVPKETIQAMKDRWEPLTTQHKILKEQ